MSTDAPKEPVPAPAAWWKPYIPWLIRVALVIVGAVLAHYAVPPAVVEVIREVPVAQAPPADGGGYSPVAGWVRDEDAIAANLDPAKTVQFAATPAARVALGDDEDVFLWRAVREAAGKAAPWYPNVNQRSVGCCVGCGWKHSCDVVQASAIKAGARFQWKPASVEVIYAGSRVDVGGGRISGDGSVGAWAKEYVADKGGIVPMEKIGSIDLTTFSPERARDWGRKGVPADLKKPASEHPVKGCALVTSWSDAKKALRQLYPIAVCSNQGFTMDRDATGRARPQGSWAHCMCIIGARAGRDGRAEGGFILNSWGDTAHTGPVWPEDAPVAGFWADAAVIDRMLKQNDSFALSDVVGFPARKLDWFVRSERRRENYRETLAFTFQREPVFSLSW